MKSDWVPKEHEFITVETRQLGENPYFRYHWNAKRLKRNEGLVKGDKGRVLAWNNPRGSVNCYKHVWVAFDTANGGEGKYFYCWVFESREAARVHIRKQHANPNHVRLSGPHKMFVVF